ncbi:MAG: RelA/SpoT family protein [Prevotellaceae bacterium]|nr:RelA/SpoT family protein [Prevotellaceae bacterium]MDD7108604.1 RelA/SpoT family protein [Prevotellaceae bacterium]MDY3294494.1 RelA/SpoT family protein [Bacteroidaceae bacterium]
MEQIEINKEEQEEKLIYDAFRKLLDTYLASNHRKNTDIITRAFQFAKQAHKGVRRLSGEPYILHPIAVAQIACEEIGLGSTSICAALLHDVEEDTDYTYEDIRNLFGQKVADIVEGLTKISGGIFGDRASLQAETFKKLLLTMSDDIRVILIKISDRLHNMRTLSSMAPNKQYKIAGETLYIYAPLADRLGLNKIKTELEDLSFRYEHPDTYKFIQEKLKSTESERELIFGDFTPPIRTALDKMGLKYEITSRVKSPYSIWRKIQDKKVSFEEIYDILAIRIVFQPLKEEEEINECFNIYVALTQIYKPHPERTRDWVNHPKANGYQGLHVTLMSNQGNWVEVQVRSQRMDEIDEKGVAAHWKYKDRNRVSDEADEKIDKWLHTIKEILNDPQPDTLDLLDTIKLNLFAKEIIVFTPKGDIKSLPADATALDFAFSIHTMLGTHCIGAKVNHVLQPLMYRLKGGDQVEILTSNRQQVKREWLSYVTTAKAKSKIQASLRRMDREIQHEGNKILQVFLEHKDLEFNSTNIEKLRHYHHFHSRDELLMAIGNKELVLTEQDASFLKGKGLSTWRRFLPFKSNKVQENEEENHVDFLSSLDHKKVLTLTDSNIHQCVIADCCQPIPTDDALGYIDASLGRLVIHKRRCDEATRLKSNFGNNIIAVKWDMHSTLFKACIAIIGIDKKGILLQIANTLYTQEHINVTALTIESKDGVFEATINIMVHNTDEVNNICTSLKEIENIVKVYRKD